MKKKILVCGSAGFIGSNIIRYITYGTKEFSIVSVDRLKFENDYRRLYVNKKQKFYVGNLLDKDFINSLINLEKPDLIINTINCNHEENYLEKIDSLRIYANLINFNIPIIQLIPSSFIDSYGIWDGIRNRNCTNNLIIEIPNCFGGRQKIHNQHPNSLLINYINKLDKKEICFINENKAPWVFVNDISSFIWFSIEKDLKGYIKMPESGYLSLEEIIYTISNVFRTTINVSYNNEMSYIIDYKYEGNKIEGFQVDNNIKEELLHTAMWYRANSWSLSG